MEKPVPIAATFEIEYLQYLDAEGKLVRDDLPAFARDTKQLVKLYQEMLMVRVFDAKAIALQRTGKLGTYAPCLGHEATYLAIGSTMQEDDCFAPSYREYGVQFHRGVKPRAPDRPVAGRTPEARPDPIPRTPVRHRRR